MEAEERTHTSVEGKTKEMRCNLGEREFNLPLEGKTPAIGRQGSKELPDASGGFTNKVQFQGFQVLFDIYSDFHSTNSTPTFQECPEYTCVPS